MPGFVDGLLRQTASYEAVTGTDDRDLRTFAPPKPVPARVQGVSREILGPNSEVINVAFRVTLAFAPSVGDLINGREVVSVATMVNVAGDLLGAEALTR